MVNRNEVPKMEREGQIRIPAGCAIAALVRALILGIGKLFS